MNKSRILGVLPLLIGLFFIFTSFSVATPVGANLQLVLIKSEPVTLQAGTYANVWLKVINRGSVNARAVELSFTDKFPFYIAPGDQRTWNLGDISAADQIQLQTRIAVNDSAVEGTNELEFRLKYNGIIVVKKINVDIGEDNPALLIGNVKTDPDYIAPGSEATVTISLKNEGYKVIRDVDVNLSFSSTIPLLPIGSASIKRIESIAPQETAEVTFKVKATESATSLTYRVPITLKFYDSAGTQHTKTEITGIKIGGMPKLVLQIENTAVLKAKKTNTVTISVVNKDMVDAKFVNLEFEATDGYQIVSPTSVYLGNIDSDDYQTTDLEVYFKHTGITNVSVMLDYSSPDGKHISEQRRIPLKVYTGREISTLGLEKKNNSWIGILVVLLAVGGYFGYRRYKKKKLAKK